MKTLLNFLKVFFSGYLNLIASLASITGLILAFAVSKQAIIISLISFIVFLIIILIRFFFVVKTFLLSKTEDGFHRFATYIRFSSEDSRHISYEVHKFMQCKTIAEGSHVHKYHWSGSADPVITSDLQDVLPIEKVPGDYDKVVLRFKKPLTYNEFCVVHIKMEIDNSDGKASPYIELSVKEAIVSTPFLKQLVLEFDRF